MQVESLEELYITELKDVYSAEKQILKALPRLVKAAASPELKNALEKHKGQTEEHVERLERIFDDLGRNHQGKKCKGMAGLLEEGQELLEMEAPPEVLDAALISAGQRVEHYEIAAYGCLRTYARLLGQERASRMLEDTLEEEKQADETLSRIAESSINLRAAEQHSE
jgi:ferritin-like metal-binding protein YciE